MKSMTNWEEREDEIERRGRLWLPCCWVSEITDLAQLRHGEVARELVTNVGQVVRKQVVYVTCI